MVNQKKKGDHISSDAQRKSAIANYYKNRETLAIKVTCVCGCIVRSSNLNQHKSSAKHINKMKNKEIQKVDSN